MKKKIAYDNDAKRRDREVWPYRKSPIHAPGLSKERLP